MQTHEPTNSAGCLSCDLKCLDSGDASVCAWLNSTQWKLFCYQKEFDFSVSLFLAVTSLISAVFTYQ